MPVLRHGAQGDDDEHPHELLPKSEDVEHGCGLADHPLLQVRGEDSYGRMGAASLPLLS